MIDKIGTDRIRDMVEQSASKQPEAAGLPQENQIDASLHVDYASLAEKISQIPEAGSSAVEEARQLISSGKLDTPGSAMEAARNILELGI